MCYYIVGRWGVSEVRGCLVVSSSCMWYQIVKWWGGACAWYVPDPANVGGSPTLKP